MQMRGIRKRKCPSNNNWRKKETSVRCWNGNSDFRKEIKGNIQWEMDKKQGKGANLDLFIQEFTMEDELTAGKSDRTLKEKKDRKSSKKDSKKDKKSKKKDKKDKKQKKKEKKDSKSKKEKRSKHQYPEDIIDPPQHRHQQKMNQS
ncbi:hypothetical protein ADUPG1_001949 [Aduncisulcus paluster]|uniref:Uncharacterized protein n=1 Tax=Aduncisulcus paluster TaxID=2918883 RepID=A0ABQ5KII9_9EUKA|nr:hypothetical protein ADUPG1_001949 [Aduncisulcus paluster]